MNLLCLVEVLFAFFFFLDPSKMTFKFSALHRQAEQFEYQAKNSWTMYYTDEGKKEN